MIDRLFRHLRSQRGFALPTVILLVALLTVLLTSGLSRSRTEQQIAMASDETATAFAIAEGGLQTYIGTDTTRPPDWDSVRINIPGGYANVVAHLVRQPADTTQRSLYLIRSTGIVINPDSGARAQATHTVAQFAEWESGYILHRAALTTANGLKKNNGSGFLFNISGNDACGAAPAIPGVRTNFVTGGSFSTDGNPGLIEEGPSTGPTIASETLIDWAGALGDDLVPDYASFQNGSSSYPIQRVSGSVTLSGLWNNGTGLLVVPNNLRITGGYFGFKGIILVGGKIEFDATFVQVRGLVVSGLNEQLGINPQRSEIGGSGNNLLLYYDSCEIQNALAPLTGLVGVRNAWLDTWDSY
jgi:hypothetical protein